jgi:hypothetical protein
MRLRVLVGRGRLGQHAGLWVAVIVALARAIDAVGPVQAGVEPLRRVRRHHLAGEHEAQLVHEGGGVFLGQRRLIRHGPPEEGRDRVLLDLAQPRRDARLAEVLLREHVARHLAPALRHVDAVEAEDHRPVRVADLAQRLAERDAGVGRLAGRGVATLEPHETHLSRRDTTVPYPREAGSVPNIGIRARTRPAGGRGSVSRTKSRNGRP